MPYKDKEKQKEYMKEKNRKYYQANKEKVSEFMKQYYQANSEKIKEQKKQYYNTPNGRKNYIINGWKQIGVINDDFDLLYEKYVNTNNCDVCKNEFNGTRNRQLDHDHETGLFRQILCQSCNARDYWKKKIDYT